MNRNGCVVIVIVVAGRKILLPTAMEDRALESFVVALVERVPPTAGLCIEPRFNL